MLVTTSLKLLATLPKNNLSWPHNVLNRFIESKSSGWICSSPSIFSINTEIFYRFRLWGTKKTILFLGEGQYNQK